MKIGPIAIPSAGERATGAFTFSGDDGLAKYEWPYIAIAGLRAGPIVLITAGIHAAEYTGIEAAIRLGRTTSPDAVRFSPLPSGSRSSTRVGSRHHPP